MAGSIRWRINQAFTPEPCLVDSLKVAYQSTAQYCCRLLGAYDFRRKLTSGLQKEPERAVKRLLDLKDTLDYSADKNRLLAAVRGLGETPKPNWRSCLRLSRKYGIEPDDIQLCLRFLSEVERLAISERPPINISSDEEIEGILTHLSKIINNLVYRQLRYVVMSTASTSFEDLVSDLQTHAVKLIRHYEIESRSSEHLIRTVVVGLKNHTDNLSWTWGRQKRQPMVRVRKVENHRAAWLFSPATDEVTRVDVPGDRRSRTYLNGNVCIRVKKHGQSTIVPAQRLYETEGEARRARQLYLSGFSSKRPRIISLNKQLDEFQSRCLSLDAPNQEGTSTLMDTLIDGKPSPSTFLDEVSKYVEPKVAEFIFLVTDVHSDPLFERWCVERGHQLDQLGNRHLGRLACRYLNINHADVKEALCDTPATLWSQQSMELLRGDV
jgi:hypothetical protein